MKLKSLFVTGAVLVAATATAHAKMITKTLDYQQGGDTLQGYLAYDDSFTGKRPGVLVAHQWMGLTDYERERARMLAQMGYVAFALDVYGKGVRPKKPRRGWQIVWLNTKPIARCGAIARARRLSLCANSRALT